MEKLLKLPISIADFDQKILTPALALLPAKMDTPQARVMLITIALQESRLNARTQMGNGPARGLLQFEKGGGVKGVMTHSAVKGLTAHVCAVRGVPFEPYAIWTALATDDVFAAALARLLLWTDPGPLPARDDPDAGWKLYAVRVWRPGKPHPETWRGYWDNAVQSVYGEKS